MYWFVGYRRAARRRRADLVGHRGSLRDMTVILLRHGRSNSNTAHTLAGRTDGIDLDDKGRGRRRRWSSGLRGGRVRAIVRSPLLRCRRTVEPLAAALGLDPLIDEAWRSPRSTTAAGPVARSVTWSRALWRWCNSSQRGRLPLWRGPRTCSRARWRRCVNMIAGLRAARGRRVVGGMYPRRRDQGCGGRRAGHYLDSFQRITAARAR